jgi:hypothetical protein
MMPSKKISVNGKPSKSDQDSLRLSPPPFPYLGDMESNENQKTQKTGGDYKSSLDELQDIGLTLFDPDPWLPRMARSIREHPRQLRRWMNGEAKMPDDIIVRARNVVRNHVIKIQKLNERMGS